METAAIITERKGFLYGYGNPKAEFYYFLEPAQYWKDFSDLTITLKLPRGMRFETSLGGFAQEGDSYVARFEKLPPKNLRILVDLSTSPVPKIIAAIALGSVVVLAVLIRRRAANRRSLSIP